MIIMTSVLNECQGYGRLVLVCFDPCYIRMLSGMYWNQPFCPSVRVSVYKILVYVKVLMGVLDHTL